MNMNMTITISYSQLRTNLKTVLDQVCLEHEPVLVERQNGDDVVLLSKEDYSAWAEAMHLLKSPANAKRLLMSLNNDAIGDISFDSVDDLKAHLKLS